MNKTPSFMHQWSTVLMIGIVAAMLGAAANSVVVHASIFDSLFGSFLKQEESGTPVPVANPYQSPIEYESAIMSAVERAAPSVVSIVVTKDLPIIERCQGSPLEGLPPGFEDFFNISPFGFNQQCQRGTREQEVGGGTGFMVSSDGLIVTNRHVVQDEQASYTVLTNDGKKYEAKVLARDPVQDIAIVKIDAPASVLKAVTLASSEVRLGQTAIVIGNALGEFRNTVSVGIISGLSRDITAGDGVQSERLEGLIQTDAAINPGNSGGPLLNLRGEVIGMNTAIASEAQNIGFSIPIEVVRRDIDSVKRNGKIESPFLGVRYVLVTPELAKRDSLSVDYGALVRGNNDGPGVIGNSPAEKAGIQAEDIILEVDGKKVTLTQSLASMIQRRQVGDVIKLKLLRAGKELTVSATLKARE